MKKIVKLGIIGCGSVARLMHIPVLLNLANRFKIDAIYDIDKTSLNHTAELISNKYSTYKAVSPEQIFRSKNIDAVAILSPTSTHLKYTLNTLKNRKHVFLEKPVTVLPQNIEKIIAAEKKFNKHVQVGMVLRYSSFFKKLIEIINSKKYGRLLWMNWLETRPFDPMLWRYTNSAADGDAIIHDKAVHQINLFNHFAGAKPVEAAAFGGQYLINPKTFKSVRAFTSMVKLKGNSNDNLMAIIKYKNGVKASITISYVSPHSRESRWIIQLEKAKIAAHFETFVKSSGVSKNKWKGHPSSIYLFKDNKNYKVPWKYPMSYPPSEKNLVFYDEYKNEPLHPGSADQWKEFYKTVTNNIKPESSLLIALNDMIVLKAIDESIKKGKIIKIL